MDAKNSLLTTYFRIARPLVILLGLFTYCLGLGLSHYLGHPLDWTNAILGLFLAEALLLSRSFLSAYCCHPLPIHSSGITRTDKDGRHAFVEIDGIPHLSLMHVSLIALLFAAAAMTMLLFRRAINLSALVVLGLGLILVFIDALPPTKIKKQGYSELIEAFMVANLVPALAFLLQGSGMHFLVITLTMPLTFIYLATSIASSFEYYGYDTGHLPGSMLALIGWQRGVVIHNMSILTAYLLTAAFFVFGMAWNLTWPLFLSLPLGIFQIIQISRLAEGAKPNWALIRVNALSTLVILIYLIVFTLWIN